MMNAVGIDVSKRKSTVTIRRPGDEIILDPVDIPHTRSAIDELIGQGLTKADCGDLEKHAYSVNDSIGDSQLRNLHILAAV